MKKSIFNFHFTRNNTEVLYNAKTGALAELSKDEYNRYIKGVDEKTDSDLIQNLTFGGFILKDNINEMKIIRHDMFADRFNTDCLALTIAPTSNCNFRCPYCYEKDVLRNSRMSDNTAESLLKYIKSNMNTIKELHITWYGGEPLLEIGRIEELSSNIIELCKENNVRYTANIITNGYFLTVDVMRKLIKAKVTNVQVTVDGIKKTHDSRRYLIDRGGTFDTIILNLKNLSSLFYDSKGFPYIGLRMNVDRSNVKDIKALFGLVNQNKLNDYVHLYLGRVHIVEDIQFMKTFTTLEFDAIVRDFENEQNNEILHDFQLIYPHKQNIHCVCDSFLSYVIDSDGLIYKCWEEMGNKSAVIGDINRNNTGYLNKDYYEYMLDDPTIRCEGCDILPICMGGACPLWLRRDKFKPNCESIKQELKKKIIQSYDMIKEERANPNS